MHTAIIATLERKGIISREEGEKLIEFLNNSPQSTLLSDAVEQVSEFISDVSPKIESVAKSAEAKAKQLADAAAAEVKSEVEQIDEAVKKSTAKPDKK